MQDYSFRQIILTATIVLQFLLSDASIFEAQSKLHQFIVSSLSSIPQHSFNLYKPAFPWNETYPYHLLRAGLPSHEIRLHPGVIMEDDKYSGPFYLAFTDFRNHSFGNHLGIYFEILACAIETKMPMEILFPFHFEPLRADSDSSIETFLSFLPSSFVPGDNITAAANRDRSTSSSRKDAIAVQSKRRLSAESDEVLALVQKNLNSICVCGEYCWSNPRSLWIRHLDLIQTISRAALDRSLFSLQQTGLLRGGSGNLTYEVGGHWEPLVYINVSAMVSFLATQSMP